MPAFSPTTALIVVDCQNDFADPSGSLFVEGGQRVVASVNRLIIRAIADDAPVFYTQDWHPESTPHFEKDGGIWPVHCVADTWGAALHPQLVVAGPIVLKGTNGEDGYSGFTMADPRSGETTPTRLNELLRERDVTATIVVGLALDYCVKATALDSAQLGYRTSVPPDATAAVNLNSSDGEAAVAELRDHGVAVD